MWLAHITVLRFSKYALYVVISGGEMLSGISSIGNHRSSATSASCAVGVPDQSRQVYITATLYTSSPSGLLSLPWPPLVPHRLPARRPVGPAASARGRRATPASPLHLAVRGRGDRSPRGEPTTRRLHRCRGRARQRATTVTSAWKSAQLNFPV